MIRNKIYNLEFIGYDIAKLSTLRRTGNGGVGFDNLNDEEKAFIKKIFVEMNETIINDVFNASSVSELNVIKEAVNNAIVQRHRMADNGIER